MFVLVSCTLRLPTWYYYAELMVDFLRLQPQQQVTDKRRGGRMVTDLESKNPIKDELVRRLKSLHVVIPLHDPLATGRPSN